MNACEDKVVMSWGFDATRDLRLCGSPTIHSGRSRLALLTCINPKHNYRQLQDLQGHITAIKSSQKMDHVIQLGEDPGNRHKRVTPVL